MSAQPGFVFGSQYYRPPEPPKADWERDLLRMREAGFNTVKFWACWGWMNPSQGVYDFADIDELMDLAQRVGLGVVLNVILENCPYWAAHQYPDARYLTHDGQRIDPVGASNTPTGGWPGLCFDNESAWQIASLFVSTLVDRYRNHSALTTWDIWNEPHLEPSWYYPDRLFCYCEASLSRFRSWLKDRYGGLADLNQAWSRRYSDWAEVVPPRAFESYPDLLDWRTFWLENLTSWLRARVKLAKSIDADHSVMTHVASSSYLGTLAANTWDEWLLAEPVDQFGTSSFPQWLMGNDGAIHAFHLAATRDACRGKNFWQSELQGGRGRREGWRTTAHPDPESIRLWIWNALAAGAKGVLFWQWRPELLGPESPGYGLCTPSGEPTERVEAARQMAELVHSFPDLVESAPVPAEVGLMVSRQAALLTYAGDRSMDLYASALSGAWRAFWDNDVPIQIVHEDEVASGKFPPGLKALYWPMPLAGSKALANGLSEFVSLGGTLIAEASPAAHVEHGWASARVPGLGLDVLFGAEEVEADAANLVDVRLDDGGSVQGFWARSQLRPLTGRVRGRFTDGSPALVENRRGQGRALLVATYPSLAYDKTRHIGSGRWIAGSIGRATQPIEQAKSVDGLHTSVRRRGDRLLVFAINWSSKRAQTRLLLGRRRVRSFQASDGLVQHDDGGIGVDLPPMSGALCILELIFEKEKVSDHAS